MKRIAIIDYDKCKPKKCNYKCIKMCPVYRFKKDIFKLDEKGFPIISEVLCTGCGICQNFCPYGAIKLVRLPEEEEEKLVHKYKSGFRLYGLPPLKEDSILGIIGPNGTGKSTTVKILSGQIIPNFGKDEENKELVLEKFRKTEYYNYFSKLYEGKIKVVVKPQNISGIPKIVKGSVEKVIEKYDEKGIAKEILEFFEMKDILSKDVDKLSGGGLQVLAITIALSRNADVLFLDEPSIYLDVKRRFSLVKILNEFKAKTTIIVDHDIVVLDAICDYITILYGIPAAFGIYSGIKTVKNGINEFLEGYLKEENVRIRSKPIKFEKRIRIEASEEEEKVIVEYTDIEKTYPGFKLKIEAGTIYSHDIIGVIGPNGTGKSTFAKILTGNEQPDKGSVVKNIKIAYKPQEIFIEGKTVKEFIGSLNSFILNEVLKPLEIEKLLDFELENLSGGELQKVWIAKTLAQDADLYVLDEPSAFLDVENRVKLSKILANFIEKKKKALFIIDHDLQLIDYLCSKVILFRGKSNVEGFATKPMEIFQGLNEFLKDVNMTFRRDEETYRLRSNKPGSRKDQQQREENIYYPL